VMLLLNIKAKARGCRFKGQNASYLLVKGCTTFMIVRLFCVFDIYYNPMQF
jgi:hypothetical protein